MSDVADDRTKGLQATEWEAERQAHPEMVEILIQTRVPSKWRFVDLETGQVFAWDEHRDLHFKAMDVTVKLEASDATRRPA